MIALMVVTSGLLVGLWFTVRLRPIPGAPVEGSAASAGADRRVSIIIPARDEAPTLPHLLASITTATAGVHEVMVVDDGSTDATAEVAAAGGAEVVALSGPPPGWAGKPYACARGAERATGDVLIFLDADVRLLPGALERLVAAHAEAGGLLSVQPYHRPQRWYEELSAMFNVVSVVGSGAFAPWPRPRRPVAFGPCVVTSRADYIAVGGHGAVRAEIIEDIALARVYRRAGRPVSCRVGRGAVEFRMYPGGVGQLVEGWTKNIAAGAGATDPVGLVAGVWFVVACVTAATFAATAGWRGRLDATDVAVAAAMWCGVAAVLQSILRRLGRFRWSTALLFPIATLAFVAVFARSAWLTVVGRQVRWRGRTVAVGRSRPD